MIPEKHHQRKIFQDSALIAKLCSFCDVSDCVRMARVSRVGFAAAVPFVWRHVEGVHNFLVLVPGLDVKPDPEYETAYLGLARWPKDVSPSAQARLKLYASSVKTLNIHTKSITRHDSFDWPGFALHLQSQSLLPNLESFDMTNSHGIYSRNYPLWVKAFACKSLTEALFSPCFTAGQTWANIDPHEELEGAIRVLIDKAPNIRKISLFPGISTRELSVGSLSSSTNGTLSFASLRSLPELCGLSTNLGTLITSLGVLSSLPRLQSLAIWSGGLRHALFTQDLSNISFSALTHLSLRLIDRVDADDMDTLASILAVLGRQIITLRIDMDIGGRWAKNTLVLDRFFPPLKNFSCLRDLYFNCAPDYRKPVFLMGAHSTVLDSILPLHNLETVCLDWVYFVSAIPEGLQRKTTWRQVTYLSMPSHRAWVHTMFDFARLPNLQHLVLELGLSTDFPDESSDSDEDGQEKPVGLKLHTLEGGFNSRLFGRRDGEDPLARRQTNELARRLLVIWPNLRRVVWPTVKNIPAPELEGIRLLNLQITEPWRISSSDDSWY